MRRDLSGFINIYKEKGFTSHDVVNIVRNKLNKTKTGHTGTLDPDAEGVLPLCIGKATKLADYVSANIKEYRAEITLGITTTTEDIWGEVLERKEAELSDSDIIAAIKSFEGEYAQKPPMYSAVKVNGRKLYELAREGKEIERKTRLIHIYEIKDIEKTGDGRFVFSVLCSKGTYIRTLCSDIGKRLGCGGCMSSLTRTRSGSFYIEDSIKIDEFRRLAEAGDIEKIIISMDSVLQDYRKVTASENADKYIQNGNKISVGFLDSPAEEGEMLRVYDSHGRLAGIYKVTGEYAKPVTMLI